MTNDFALRVVRAAVANLPSDSGTGVDAGAVIRAVMTELREALLDMDPAEVPPQFRLLPVDTVHGVRDAHLAAALASVAAEFATALPALSAALYGAAVDAGLDPRTVAASRAEACALAGDMSTALGCAELAMRGATPAEYARTIGTAATILSHRGLASTAAALYRGVGADRLGAHSALAALSMYVTGDRADADALLEAARADAAPTLASSGTLLLAEAMELSLHGTRTAVLSRLANATSLLEPAASDLLLPCTPAVIGGTLAMHCGEFATARAILDRAIRTDLGGPAFRVRHRLLRAWVAMVTGQIETARRLRDEAVAAAPAVELRDEYLLHALTAGIARRSSDVAGLQAAWQQARETVLEFQVDLLSLLPFGELVVAAARVREPFRLDVQLADAMALLERLGDPPLWSAMVHWLLMQSAILAETPDAMVPHIYQLTRFAEVGGFHKALADAAVMWQRTVAGHVEFAATASAARQLDAHGLPWDASRLAAQAAARTTDRKVMVDLLHVARQLQPHLEQAAPPTSAPQPTASAPPRPSSSAGPSAVKAATSASGDPDLSPREFEVARLVLAGQTYRQIGERLFISSKTVEHHIARIRKRLGANSRSELFALMQAALDRSGGSQESVVRWLQVTPTVHSRAGIAN